MWIATSEKLDKFYFGYTDIRNNKVANELFNCVLKNINYQKDPEKAD